MDGGPDGHDKLKSNGEAKEGDGLPLLLLLPEY